MEEKSKHSQVVMLNEVSQSAYQKNQDSSEESEPVKTRNGVPQSIYLCQREIQEFAAIKIQTAFRGYLVSLSNLFCLAFNPSYLTFTTKVFTHGSGLVFL